MIENKYSVYVRCITYNHANYIKDTFNGFCMQQTTFPFVCAIFDDASTDGEIEIIKDYLNENFELDDAKIAFTKETDDYVLQYVRHKVNRNCFFVVVFLKYNHWRLKKAKDIYVQEWIDKSEYIAECEGDDYWIDPLKLQKQVDFLDKHEDYSVCCGGYQRFFEGALEKEIVFNRPNCSGFSFTLEDNLQTWYTQPLTSMFRREFANEYYNNISLRYNNPRDTVKFYHLLSVGKGYYFQSVMGVYNVHEGGVFSMVGAKRNAMVYCDIWSEIYYKNNKDPRIKPVLFKWICIKIQECRLSAKETMPLIKEAQRLVSSIKEESILLQAVMFWIKRKVIR